jgi:hypothetical protein
MNAYWKRQPIVAVSRFNEDSTQYVSHLRIIEPPPIDWAIRFGEAVHNMRSALDHVIYQLTIRHHGGPLAKTGFPIFLDREPFERFGQAQIRGLLPAAQAVIEGLQPYHAPKPKDTVLWNLQESWNQDKHRIVQLMAAVSRKSSLAVVPPVPCRTMLFNGLHEDGAKIAEIIFREPSPHVKVHFEIQFQIVDKNTWNPDEPATVTYEEVLSEVSRIIGQLTVMMV